MKSPILLLISFFLLLSCSKHDPDDSNQDAAFIDDDLAGPISRPKTGYGSDGNYQVAKISFPSPLYSGKNVEIFYPKGIISPKPVIFYSHPYAGEQSEYNIGLYEFISKKGYVVVFAPYPTTGVTVEERYDTLWQSFKKAVRDYPEIIDTKKVGFMGHSFGAGACFALAHRGFLDEGWGENGRFIFAMAQWFSYEITPAELQSFPENTKLITQVYNDDTTNDHRLAIDIFKNINIPNTEKDFILIKKSVLPTFTYTAEHNLPNTQSSYDAYDYYGIYRLLDAMIDYSFNGNAAAKNVALGNGSKEQVTMPSYNGQVLSPLEITDNPSALYPQSKYSFQCGALNNPRIANCN
ncbi:alpha/beta hydrolase [Flavobacterium sp. SLB02]|uniref:alpha/beta hydrolase n=1 Tax=Flavobacterium sp. SLB02 TaxID=2665645 RepID=UPI0012AA8002|nr:alpha/beta hydrolase [Flavobacterium sp. SLB02]QGK73389.1 alpha/beta hydrolase [Flavobacterium sp. SLB02]